jgi:hypothetical protein
LVSLALEYVVRNGITKQLFETPCSLYYQRPHDRKVVAVHQIPEGYSIKHWNLMTCDGTAALPPMEEFYTSDPFDDSNVLLNDWKLLSYSESPAPNHFNNWRRPMPDYLYEKYCDNFFRTMLHYKKRKEWLWKVFIQVYSLVFPFSKRLDESRDGHIRRQQLMVEELLPKQWKCWKLWQKHMEFNTSPGDLVFKNQP